MDVNSLSGIAVVSIEHGEKVGTIDNAIFNLESRRVIAFKIRKSSMPGSGRMLISMDDIQSIGPDAVMIQNKDCLRKEKGDREFHNWPDLAAISGLRVVTQAGAYVGNLSTIQFDPKTGNLTAIETSGGGLMDLLRRNKVIDIAEVISIGTDVVVVPDAYSPGEPDQESEGENITAPRTTKNDQTDTERVFQLPAGSNDSRHQ